MKTANFRRISRPLVATVAAIAANTATGASSIT
jgi:hypothetical protein